MLDRLGGLRMKSIDDAIKHYEEVAEEKECLAHSLTKDGWQEHFNDLSQEKEAEYKNVREEMANSCLECASDHRQLAEWLRTLKAYGEARKAIEGTIEELKKSGDDTYIKGLELAEQIIHELVDEEEYE